jgi:hypothetical protein
VSDLFCTYSSWVLKGFNVIEKGLHRCFFDERPKWADKWQDEWSKMEDERFVVTPS